MGNVVEFETNSSGPCTHRYINEYKVTGHLFPVNRLIYDAFTSFGLHIPSTYDRLSQIPGKKLSAAPSKELAMCAVHVEGKRVPCSVLIAIGLILLPHSSLRAQQNAATIVGTVTDPTGAAIAGAKLTAKDHSTGFVRAAESDGSGSFVIP